MVQSDRRSDLGNLLERLTDLFNIRAITG